jgi:hypothetical protein
MFKIAVPMAGQIREFLRTMRHRSIHPSRQLSVTAWFGDHHQSFDLAAGTTFGQLAERLADVRQLHHGCPLTGLDARLARASPPSPEQQAGKAGLQALTVEHKAYEREEAEGGLSPVAAGEPAGGGTYEGPLIDAARGMARVHGLYQELLDAPVPDDFLRLIRALEEKERTP